MQSIFLITEPEDVQAFKGGHDCGTGSTISLYIAALCTEGDVQEERNKRHCLLIMLLCYRTNNELDTCAAQVNSPWSHDMGMKTCFSNMIQGCTKTQEFFLKSPSVVSRPFSTRCHTVEPGYIGPPYNELLCI